MAKRIWKEVRDWGWVLLVVANFGWLGARVDDYFDDQRRDFFIAKLDTSDKHQKTCALVGLINDTYSSYDECMAPAPQDKSMVIDPDAEKPRINYT